MVKIFKIAKVKIERKFLHLLFVIVAFLIEERSTFAILTDAESANQISSSSSSGSGSDPDPWNVFYGQEEEVGRTDGGESTVKFCYSSSSCSPKTWSGLCQSGKFQSPINLDVSPLSNVVETSIIPIIPIPILAFSDEYKKNQKGFYFANNGHSVITFVEKDFTSNSTFSHMDKNSTYTFAQLHFHWGGNDETGSEHSLREKYFPMELHLVHYKAQYKDLAHAMVQNDEFALAVLGVFFTIGNTENKALKPLVDSIQNNKLTETSGTSEGEGILNLFELLPKKKEFYRYRGGLTIPGCTENIQWAVFSEPTHISSQQMAVFRSLQSSLEVNGKLENARPVQPLNERQVEFFSDYNL